MQTRGQGGCGAMQVGLKGRGCALSEQLAILLLSWLEGSAQASRNEQAV